MMVAGRNYPWLSWFLLALILTLMGLISLYSVCYAKIIPWYHTVFGKQVFWTFLGIVLFFVIQKISINQIYSSSYVVYGICLFLLIVVFAFEHQGVHRWISFGNVRLQPSEISKIGVVLALSRYLSKNNVRELSLKFFLGTFLLVLCPVILILLEPDLGTSIVFIVLWVVMVHLAHIPLAMSLLLFVPIVTFLAGFQPVVLAIVLFLLVIFLCFYKTEWHAKIVVFVASLLAGLATPIVWGHLADYQKQRILIFVGLQADPQGGAYQVIQSKLAIGSGGFWGKGFLHGSQTQLRFLPEQHTDFIFSVLGEEFGFVGALFLMIVFLVLVIRGTLIAIKFKNLFAGYLLAGCVVILSFQIFVNIGMTTGMVPVTGLPLPFLSYGGSSMCMSWILTGLMAKLASRRQY